MKKVLVVAAIAAALWFAKLRFAPGAPAGSARTPDAVAKVRFEQFMKSWKAGGVSLNDSEQAAACIWGRGTLFIKDRDDLRDVADAFERWRKERQLYVADIEYDILRYQREGDHTVVLVTINGTKHRIGIPDTANPMFWVD